MTTERALRDRLTDLAEEAPAGGPVPDLWERGRRVARRRRAGTAIIAAVVVLVVGVLGATSWERTRSAPAPAGPVHDGMRLPDRFYEPSRWLPSTTDAGPLGRVSAVMGSPSGRVVGVSAADGEYRYLDLPGWSDLDDTWGATEIALSHDGRYVAYWPRDGERVVGLAVYDTETGKYTPWSFDTPHGLGPQGIVWVGEQVWFSAGTIDDADGTSTSNGQLHVWDLATGERTSTPGFGPTSGTGSANGSTLIDTSRRSVAFYERPDEPEKTLRADHPLDAPTVLSPTGDRLAAALDTDGTSTFTGKARPLLTLVPDGDGRLVSHQVPSIRTNTVIAWRDQDHLVVFDNAARGYLSVDVDTGDSAPLVDPVDNWTPGLQVAEDAWRAPSYDAPEPPHPLDPRLVWGGSSAVVVLGVGALVLWRRRVRA